MNENDLKLLVEVDQRSKSNTHQIDGIKDEIKEIKAENKAIYELTTSVKLIAQDMGTIKDGLAEVKQGQSDLNKKVSDIENKPEKKTADRIEKVRVAAYTAVASMLATGIVGGIIVMLTK